MFFRWKLYYVLLTSFSFRDTDLMTFYIRTVYSFTNYDFVFDVKEKQGFEGVFLSMGTHKITIFFKLPFYNPAGS